MESEATQSTFDTTQTNSGILWRSLLVISLLLLLLYIGFIWPA